MGFSLFLTMSTIKCLFDFGFSLKLGHEAVKYFDKSSFIV